MRFVHIVRNPYVVFPSTVNLWKSLYETHGLQKPTFMGLEEHVFATFVRLYERLEHGKTLVPKGRFVEIRYEHLVRDPEKEMQRIYEELEMGGFEEVRPALRQYVKKNADYKTNRFRPLEPELHAEITRRWGDVIRRYDYD